MAKKLRVRDRLLLVAAILGDFYFEQKNDPYLKLKKLMGVLPPDYEVSNFSSVVCRLLKTGQIERVIRDGEPFLRLTNTGKGIITRAFSLFKLRRKRWDGFWRIVFYDIPEEEKKVREGLKEKLQKLGFGRLQESVYLSPLDVAEDLREFLVVNNLEDKVFVSVSKQLLAVDKRLLSGKIWPLGELNDRYLELERKIAKQTPVQEILEEYQEILREDPCLPPRTLTKQLGGRAGTNPCKEFLEKRSNLVPKLLHLNLR